MIIAENSKKVNPGKMLAQNKKIKEIPDLGKKFKIIQDLGKKTKAPSTGKGIHFSIQWIFSFQ